MLLLSLLLEVYEACATLLGERVYRAPQGGTVKLVARHERAGTVRTEVELA